MSEDEKVDEVLAKLDSFVETTKIEETVVGFNAEGMHPGVVNGRRVAPLENTSKPYKGKGGKLGKHLRRLENRRNACEATHRSVQNQAAFKNPGSMKQANG